MEISPINHVNESADFQKPAQPECHVLLEAAVYTTHTAVFVLQPSAFRIFMTLIQFLPLIDITLQYN